MPVRRKPSRPSRRRRFPSRSVAKKPVDKRQDRSIFKLYKMVKYSKEKKYVDQSRQTSIGTTWTNILPFDLTYIPQGIDDNDRIGNKIKVFNHHIKVIATCGDSDNLYRLMVVRFGALPTASVAIQQVLETPTAPTPFQMLSFKKRNADCKYQILWDSGVQKLAGNASAATSPAGPASQRVHNIRLKSSKGWFTQYSGPAADTVINGFTYLVAVTNSTILPNVGFQTTARTIFCG